MERRRNCPICSDSGGTIQFEERYDSREVLDFVDEYYDGNVEHSYLEDEAFVIRHCSECDFHWHEYILDDDGMYELYENWIASEESRRKRNSWWEREQSIIQSSYLQDCFDKPPGETKVLDYGMGWGSYLLAAQSYGCDVYGYELSESRRKYANSVGIPTFESVADIDDDFDFIAFHQTLEHVPNPRELLDDLEGKTADGGVVHITTPRSGTVSSETVLSKGPYQPLEHVNAFTRDSLIEIGERAGDTPFEPSSNLVRIGRVAKLRGLVKALLELSNTTKIIKKMRGDTDVFLRF